MNEKRDLVDELKGIERDERDAGLDRESRWLCPTCARAWLFPAYLTNLRCPFDRRYLFDVDQ